MISKIKENFLYKAITYFIAILLSIIIMIITMELWNADMRIPFTYEGDGLSVASLFKGFIDNNSIISNKFIGYPANFSFLETPMSDWLHILMARFITLFTNEYGLALNIFYLLTFPLTTIISLTVFLRLKISSFSSIIGSLLYTFIPYHFMRGENHLFLSAYYMVPLAIMLVMMIIMDEEIFFSYENGRYRFAFFNLKTIGIFILSILIASSGVYYAYFSCFFLVVVGLISIFKFNNMRKFFSSIIIISFIGFGCVLNVVPHIVYNNINSSEKVSSVERSALESEVYGLKISQLILPVTGHRIKYFEEKKDLYEQRAPLVNENGTAALGAIGSLGFLISLAYIYVDRKNSLIREIGLLNLSAVLLGTIGGFSTIVAFILTDMIRSYNRISVFISFLSIVVIVYIFDSLYKKYVDKRKLIIVLGVMLTLVGIYDQTSSRYIPKYNEISLQYNSDSNFINIVENNIGSGSKILQMPYIPFPEEPSPYKMGYYDMLKPYLHSENLYWSYGSTKGKQNDLWLKEVSSKNPEELVREISSNKFNGVFIDSFGYENKDDLKKLIDGISNTVGISPIVSDNDRYIFIKLNM